MEIVYVEKVGADVFTISADSYTRKEGTHEESKEVKIIIKKNGQVTTFEEIIQTTK